MTVARDLACGPTRAYGIAKSLVNQAAGVDRLDYHLDQELEHLSRIADGSDFAAGLEGFLTKKTPTFTGGQNPPNGGDNAGGDAAPPLGPHRLAAGGTRESDLRVDPSRAKRD